MEYIHPMLNEQNMAIGGYYMIAKEGTLPFKGREVLYLVGWGILDNSCCGAGGCGYAIVPGYVVDWHTRKTQDQRYISNVEPIEEAFYKDIGMLLRNKENVTQIHFRTASGDNRVHCF